jgi:transmembrane protein 33
MRIVAYIELLVCARVFIGALTFQTSIIAPIVYAHFIRQRYYQSSFTREAISATDSRIDKFARKPGTHAVVVKVWDKTRPLIVRWGGSILAPQQPTGPARH